MSKESVADGIPPLQWMVNRLVNMTYEGGYNGTCYQCPFATEPLDRHGTKAIWSEISNDPTEAYFRCTLPGRPDTVAWGEYALCSEKEWVAVILSMLPLTVKDNDEWIAIIKLMLPSGTVPDLDSGNLRIDHRFCPKEKKYVLVNEANECKECGART